MDKVIVSVVIPTYKRADMLGRAIDSVLEQTYSELEVIVVDDNDPGSEYRKKTEQFMRKYESNSKVIYIKHEKNKNGAAARNTGIKCSKGKYIALLDDDDFFYPLKIEKQVNFLDNSKEYSAVYCGRVQRGKKICGELQGDLSKEILLKEFTPTTPALMFRKEALLDIGGFDESFKRHQDYELLLKFFKKYKIGVIKEALVEIGENEGENEIHGKELEKTKIKFINMFETCIEELDKKYPGYKKNVYIIHSKDVFFDYISTMNLKRAGYVYMKACRVSFIKFNVAIIKYLIYYCKFKYREKR